MVADLEVFVVGQEVIERRAGTDALDGVPALRLSFRGS